MAARQPHMDRTVPILLWAGRVIAGAWGVIFLVSISAEVASGFLPGGSALSSAFNFASAIFTLVGVALSFWRAWVGGLVLLVVWLTSCLTLVFGLEPQADIVTGLVVTSLVALLPGLLLIAASMVTRQRANAAAAGTPTR
jgi:hypothetical protein